MPTCAQLTVDAGCHFAVLLPECTAGPFDSFYPLVSYHGGGEYPHFFSCVKLARFVLIKGRAERPDGNDATTDGACWLAGP